MYGYIFEYIDIYTNSTYKHYIHVVKIQPAIFQWIGRQQFHNYYWIHFKTTGQLESHGEREKESEREREREREGERERGRESRLANLHCAEEEPGAELLRLNVSL